MDEVERDWRDDGGDDYYYCVVKDDDDDVRDDEIVVDDDCLAVSETRDCCGMGAGEQPKDDELGEIYSGKLKMGQVETQPGTLLRIQTGLFPEEFLNER